MKTLGYEDVYHLEGGILKYLETVPPSESLWEGECFVFDERVSVGHALIPGEHTLCRACRQPLQDGATDSPLFETGSVAHAVTRTPAKHKKAMLESASTSGS